MEVEQKVALVGQDNPPLKWKYLGRQFGRSQVWFGLVNIGPRISTAGSCGKNGVSQTDWLVLGLTPQYNLAL